jgi:hypothetical protein
MGDILAGPGQGLPFPQALYPPSLYTTPFTAPTNKVTLQAGQQLTIPAGTWIVSGGATNPVTGVEYLDPVTLQWTPLTEPGAPFAIVVRSDGFNFRVVNSSGSPTGATVSTPGSGYNPANTTVTASAGGSTWQAIVGGALGAVTIVNGGANYTIPPIVVVGAPKPPGIAATGIAVLTAGAVTGVTWTNPGAGYGPTTPPGIVFVPSPNDPSPNIQPASATVVLTGAGTVTGVVMTSPGAPGTALPTLTIAGSGTGAAATVTPEDIVAAANDTVTIQPASGF